MKKHPILSVEYQSTIKLAAKDKKVLDQYLITASRVFEKLLKKDIIKSRKDQTFRVSLLICGDERIRKLNREHRSKDKVTDVLSFPSFDTLRKAAPAIDEIHLGDMAICFPQTIRQAREYDIGLWDEFIHLYFHGLLHLIGYDHEVSGKEEKLMQKWEDEAVDLFSDIKKGS